MNEGPIFDHEKLDVYQIELLFNHLRFSVCERGGQPTISVTNHRPPRSFSSFVHVFRANQIEDEDEHEHDNEEE
jgi:hypothetical protein